MSKTYQKNGIEYSFVPSSKKWHFRGKFADGRDYVLIEAANGIEKANKIASSVAGSLKRAFAGCETGLDNMAKGQIRKILAN